MCVSDWNKEYPLHIEQRSKERAAAMIESYITITYNAMRKHCPEVMQPVENK
jgi:hypothetical protein